MDLEVLLFDKTAFDCCKLMAKNYSTSFYLGIQFLSAPYRGPISAIYAFVRYADEIVDTFLQVDREMLEKFKADTYAAIQSKLSLNPVLHAYQLVVNHYKIDVQLIDAFFRSMEMDLNVRQRYDEGDYEMYIYGSGEVVGLMCLRVVCENCEEMYDELSEHAQKLGAALRKVNFLRDMKSNFVDRGHYYFPGTNYADFDEPLKKRMEEDIEANFDKAYQGIVRLPDEARSGVEVTYLVYRKLFDKIKGIPANSLVQDGRVNQSKWFLLRTPKFLYLWVNLLVMFSSVLSALYFDVSHTRNTYKVKERVGAIIVSAAIFIYWDELFSRLKVWQFNQKYILGVKLFGLPIEECLFFVSVPFSCLYIYDFVKTILPRNAIDNISAQYIFTFLIVSCVLFGLYNYNRIYSRVVSSAAVIALALHYHLFQFDLFGYVLMTLVLHYIPFFIVDGILTGSFVLSEALFYYNKSHICNVRMFAIPVEDAIYSFAWFLTYVSAFEYLH